MRFPVKYAALLLSFALPFALPAEAASVTYTVWVPDLKAEIVRGISVGEAVTDGAGKEKAGWVVAVRTEAAAGDRYDEKTDSFVSEAVPDLFCLLLSVRCEANEQNGIPYAGTLRLRVGETVALHLPHLSAEGRITEVLFQ